MVVVAAVAAVECIGVGRTPSIVVVVVVVALSTSKLTKLDGINLDVVSLLLLFISSNSYACSPTLTLSTPDPAATPTTESTNLDISVIEA